MMGFKLIQKKGVSKYKSKIDCQNYLPPQNFSAKQPLVVQNSIEKFKNNLQ